MHVLMHLIPYCYIAVFLLLLLLLLFLLLLLLLLLLFIVAIVVIMIASKCTKVTSTYMLGHYKWYFSFPSTARPSQRAPRRLTIIDLCTPLLQHLYYVHAHLRLIRVFSCELSYFTVSNIWGWVRS